MINRANGQQSGFQGLGKGKWEKKKAMVRWNNSVCGSFYGSTRYEKGQSG